MWTPTTRQQHSRPVTRYQTDLTDAEWRVIAPHLPKPCAAWPMREITGCPWRLLPNELPPWGTIYRWFAAWRDDGCFERMQAQSEEIETLAERHLVPAVANPTEHGAAPRLV
jgi:hypothetical protein